jgi:hypothetical protein
MTTAPSLPRQIGAGVVASLASGLLGGIVLGLVIFAGSLLVEMLTGYPVLSELLDGFGEAVFIYMFAGGAFGLFFGVPYAALLGHGCLWLTRNAPERLMSTSVLAGAVITALIVGVGNSLVQVSDTTVDLADLASLILLMSVCGAVAGSFAAFIFVIVRRAIAKPGAPKPDDEVDDTIDEEGSPDHA